MTAKEKAVELYNKYEQLGKDFTRGVSMAEFAKECALIAVDEIIKIMYEAGNRPEFTKGYWKEVKKEIELL